MDSWGRRDRLREPVEAVILEVCRVVELVQPEHLVADLVVAEVPDPSVRVGPRAEPREEVERWVKTLSKADRQQAESFFTVIRRDANRGLKSIPYSEEYRNELAKPTLPSGLKKP